MARSPPPRCPPLDGVQPLNLLLDVSVLDRLKREMRHDLQEAAVMCVSATPAATREDARRLLTRKARELRWTVQTDETTRDHTDETVTGTYLGVVFTQQRTAYAIQEVFTFPHAELEFSAFPARFGVCGTWLPGTPALKDIISAFEREHLAAELGDDRLVYVVAAYEAVCEFFGIT